MPLQIFTITWWLKIKGLRSYYVTILLGICATGIRMYYLRFIGVFKKSLILRVR